MKTYKVYLHSKPGMWTYYSGHVAVIASSDADEKELFSKAVRQLRNTTFPDRPGLSAWVFDRAEVVN